MGTKAVMSYTPEQDGVQDKAGAAQDMDQWVGGQCLDDFYPKPPLQKKTPSQPKTEVLEIGGQERRYDFGRDRQPWN